MAGGSPSERIRSLPWHLGLMSVALVVPILLLVAVIVTSFARNERLRVEADALRAARTLASVVDRELTALDSALDVLARAPSLARDDFASFEQLARTVSERYGADIALRGRDGQVLLTTRSEPAVASRQVPDLDWERLRRGQAVVTGVFEGPRSGQQVYALRTAVLRSGDLIYVLSFTQQVSRLRDLLRTEAVPRGWRLAIVDGDGRFMARNERHEEFVGRRVPPDLVGAADNRPEGTWDSVDDVGASVFGAFGRSRLANWRIAVGVQRAELDAPVQRWLMLFGTLGLALALLSMMLTFVTARRVTTPIGVLERWARLMGEGRSLPAQPLAIRELDQVGQAMGTASRELVAKSEDLQRSRDRLRLALDGGRLSAFEWDVASRRGHFEDRRGYDLLGISPHDPPRDPAEFLRALVHPDEAARILDLVRGAIDAREPFRFTTRIRMPGGARWVEVAGEGIEEDGRGKLVGIVADVTEKHDTQARLEASEARFRAMFEAVPIGLLIADAPRGRLSFANPAAKALLGVDPVGADEAGAEALQVFDADLRPVPPGEHPLVRALDGERPSGDYRVRRPDGTLLWFRASAAPIRDERGDIVASLVAFADIAAEKEEKERRELMIRELHHRVKNTLQTVQSIASSTLRATPDPAAFRQTFTDRLTSLARTHTLLTDHSWERIALRMLIDGELAPYEEAGRVFASGPAVDLPSDAALALGMALHELAMNAVKFGSLSDPSGTVRIDWSLGDAEGGSVVVFRWLERGGPVVETPRRTGFGSRVLTRVLGQQLKGEVRMEYAPAGLEVEIRMPYQPAAAAGNGRPQ